MPPENSFFLIEIPLMLRLGIRKSSSILPSISHIFFTVPCQGLMFTEITFKDSALSTVTSLKDKWSCRSYSFSFSTVISPDLQKEKMLLEKLLIA